MINPCVYHVDLKFWAGSGIFQLMILVLEQQQLFFFFWEKFH